jgi:F-type H+-transporting ATPase subunit alpha
MIIYAGTKGFLDDVPVDAVKRFESEFQQFMDGSRADIKKEINEKRELSDIVLQGLDEAIREFKKVFLLEIKK